MIGCDNGYYGGSGGGFIPGPIPLVGIFTPSAAQECPDTTGITSGVWGIEGLTEPAGYTFSAAIPALARQTVHNGNGIIWDGTTCSIVGDYLTVNLDGNGVFIDRNDTISGVAPTLLEIPYPINGDTYVVHFRESK